MKYGIPTDDGKKVSAVFGRAKSFAIYDDATRELAIMENEGANSEHGAGTGAAAFLVEKGVRIVLAPEVGPKASAALKTAGIEIQDAYAGMGIQNILPDSCADARSSSHLPEGYN